MLFGLCAFVPFIHAHLAILLPIIFFFLFISQPSKKSLLFLALLGICWLPQVLFLIQRLGPTFPLEGTKPNFFRLQLGWLAPKGKFFWFWFVNTGIFLPLAFVSLLSSLRQIARPAFVLFIFGLLIFTLANCFVFQPWDYDNHKLFIFWYLAWIPIVALGLGRLSEVKRQAFAIPLTILLFFTLTFSGILDLAHAFKKDGENNRFLSQEELQFAQWAIQNISSDAVILTAPTMIHPFMATGNPIVLGYWAHSWAHGLPTEHRLKDIQAIYDGTPEALALIKKYNVQYIYYGWWEMDGKYPKEFVERSFPKVYERTHFALFRVNPEASGGSPQTTKSGLSVSSPMY